MSRKPPELLLANPQESPEIDENGIMDVGDRDDERAWDRWIEGLKQNESEGRIHVHRMPVDSDGSPFEGKGARLTHCGSWSHLQYDFEDLVEEIRKGFLKPGETAPFRFAGAQTGKRGTYFKRIVTITRRADESAGSNQSVTALFKAMQEGNQENARMLREIIRPSESAKEAKQETNFGELALKFATVLGPVIGSVTAALISRPARPKSDLGELISAMSAMRDFASGKTEDADAEGGTIVSIIKAVAPAFPELLKTLGGMANTQPQANPAPRPALPPPADLSRIPSSQLPNQGVAMNLQPKPQVAAQSSPDQETTKMLLELKKQLEELADLAAQGISPQDAAEIIATTIVPALPEKALEILGDNLETPQKFAVFHKLSQKVASHAQWFEDFRAALDKRLFSEDEGSNDVQT